MDRTIIREARAGDAAGVARVHIESWRTTYRGIVPDSRLDTMSVEESGERWISRLAPENRRAAFFVAEAEGSVVGFASGGPRRGESSVEYDGELYALYLLRESQGEGVGRLLFEAVARKMAEVECHAMLAWVMAKNAAARRFYEAMGGKIVGRDRFEIEGQRIEEVAYGWNDARALAKAPV